MKKNNKLLKHIFVLISLIFLCSYVVSQSGYYEYSLQSKKNLTEEGIKDFENDVKEGKYVDITNYLKDTSNDYSTPLTRVVVKTSKKVNNYLKDSIEIIFKFLNKLVEDEKNVDK